MYSRTRVKIIIITLVAVVVIVGGIFGYLQLTEFKHSMDEKNQKIAELQKTITNIGDLITAYVVRADVKAGKEVSESDLQPVDMPSRLTGSLVTNLNDIKNKYYKMDLKKGTAISADMIADDKLDDSTRLFDVITDENPLGIQPGQYVDVRISMPLGEDFVAMTHKRVQSINGGVLKLAINELDIHTYNSMLVDRILYPGTRIYAVEYAEPGIQKAASDYYPVSTNVLAIVQKDPNLLSAIRPDVAARRSQLEISLKTALNPDVSKVLQKGKEEITKSILEGDKELQKELADQAKAEKKAQQALQKKQEEEQQNNNQSESSNGGVVN